jgi:hypothetical protein
LAAWRDWRRRWRRAPPRCQAALGGWERPTQPPTPAVPTSPPFACLAGWQEEKRDREIEIQRANKEILDKFSEHVKQFEVEKVTRLQREAQTLKRVGDEVFRIQQKITAERTAREAAIVLMKDDFMAAHKAREKADEVFKSEMLRKMAVVEKDLEVETKNREASEEQLVNALNDYTRALQDGLRIVNRASGTGNPIA